MASGYGKKESGDRRMYASWGGLTADPEMDPELFSMLDPVHQQQKLATRKALDAGCVAFHIVDPATHQPLPDQPPLIRDWCKQHYPHLFRPVAEQTAPDLPDIPGWFQYRIPNEINLTDLHFVSVELCMSNRTHEMTAEQAEQIIALLDSHLSPARMRKDCTPRGDGSSIKTNKPSDGVMAYVWRMARFHSGADVTMPVTATWDLSDGLEALTGTNYGFVILSENHRKVTAFLDEKAMHLVRSVGGNPYAATQRWGRALGVI